MWLKKLWVQKRLVKKTSDTIKLYGHNNWKFDSFLLNVVVKKLKKILVKNIMSVKMHVEKNVKKMFCVMKKKTPVF